MQLNIKDSIWLGRGGGGPKLQFDYVQVEDVMARADAEERRD